MSKLKNRQKISEIILAVLTEKLHVKDALLLFPQDKFDKSVECAWHALLHYEADEDLRAHDIEYREEQDEYLYFLSTLLREGKDLPANILKDYKQFHGGAPIAPDEKSFWAKILNLFRFTNID